MNIDTVFFKTTTSYWRTICILCILVISKFLQHHLKAKRRAPAYSRAMRRIKGNVQRLVKG